VGEIIVKVIVSGTKGLKELDLLVDTGATFTKIPSTIAEEIGVECRYETEVELSDGSIRKRKLGMAEVQIEGIKRQVPVTVGEEGERPFIGYTALEILGFRVNPVTRKLKRVRPIEY